MTTYTTYTTPPVFYHDPEPETLCNDAEVCAAAQCSRCGHVGLAYDWAVLDSEYTPVGRCPACGHEEVF